MWTPKRIVMLTGCFLAFFASYLGYASSAVGRLDGLPPLPEPYWPPEDGREDPVVAPKGPSLLTRKIVQAFGPECDELKRPIRLDLQLRHMVLCAGEFRVQGGRVLLKPISVGMFSKDKKDGKTPEISTLRGEVAWLTFDQPVTNFSEISHRKIVEAEIHSRIEVTNNRRRAERDEDLHMSVPTGPLYYRETTHRIWTHDFVTLTDHKSKPKPHVIKGKGMEMELHTEAPPADGKPHPRKQQKDSISGINWVVLHSNVEMNLYVDGKTGLMSSTQPDKPAPVKENAKASSTAHLYITTPGHFRYDIQKDHDVANFDVAPIGPAQPARQPQHVDVIRFTEKGTDHLVCQHLTLGLKRKENAAADKGHALKGKNKEANNQEGTEIETVHATSPKRDVVLTSDAEQLIARGNDFFHDAVKGLTILKGEPEMEVEKGSDSKIFARELHIQDVKPLNKSEKPYQNISAKGPGRIHMVDKGDKEKQGTASKKETKGNSDKPQQKKIIHAYWDDLLTSTKDNGLDLLTLIGNARFVDEEADQSLKADKIKVWLEEVANNQATPAGAVPAKNPKQKPKGNTQGPDVASNRRPKHVEATGHVVTRSRDLNIHDTDRLVVWFKDVPATHLPAGTKPSQPAKQKKAPPAAAQGPPYNPAPPAANEVKPPQAQSMPRGPETFQQPPGGSEIQIPNSKFQNPVSGPRLPAQENKPPARPFDLAARRVEAKVLRTAPGADGTPSKSSIDELWCEGSVAVRQEAANPDEKPTDVKGDTLKMTARGPDLYYLVVTGDLAELQTDKIYIIGPEVNIDQSTNKAWVFGDGCMKMDSATNFQGEKLDKPVPLTVHWSKSMLFNGASAEYHGNIQAVQDNARLACKRLHVFFDRTISLKEGAKGDDPAKVRELVCDQDVRIEDVTYDGDKMIKSVILSSPGVQMIALDPDDDPPLPSAPAQPITPGKKESKGKTSAGNQVNASGPGYVRIWEPGDSDSTGPTFGSKPAAGQKGASKGARPTGTNTAKGATAGGKSAPAEMKLTYVEFQKRMDGNSKTNIAQFWENVRVLNLPCPKPDMPIDLTTILAHDLPERAVYMRCDRLKVLDHPTDGKPNKQMEGHGKVYVQGENFYGYADMVTWNQQKEQVIFFGIDGYATLYKVDRPGEKPSVLEGKKIIHNRATGRTEVYKSTSITGVTAPGTGAARPSPKKPQPKGPAAPVQRGGATTTPFSR